MIRAWAWFGLGRPASAAGVGSAVTGAGRAGLGGSGRDGDAARFGCVVTGAVGDLDGEGERASLGRRAAQVVAGHLRGVRRGLLHAGREIAGGYRPGERADPAGGEEVLECWAVGTMARRRRRRAGAVR